MEFFDLATLVSIIEKYSFVRVALQFPDELLPESTSIYLELREKLPKTVMLFITADSTWGSSVDDVSAMHYDGDLIVYFGSDLSSSGSIPVIVLPKRIPYNVEDVAKGINQSIISEKIVDTTLLLVYDPSYHQGIDDLKRSITHPNIVSAALPVVADLQNWKPAVKDLQEPDGRRVIAGLLVHEIYENSEDVTVVYVGNKKEQIDNLLLQMSQCTTIISDNCGNIRVVKGSESKEFRERYGGVLKVKDAAIIGIIVGSMGLTGHLIQSLLSRLKTLIRAARKKSYTFVMGRLNEAKLSNFPEVMNSCLDHVIIFNYNNQNNK